MSSLLKSTKKKNSTKRKDPVALLTKIEPKSAAYGLDEPTGENWEFSFKKWFFISEQANENGFK